MIKKVKQKGYSLLRKSEKYTKTDMVYLVRGTSVLFNGQMWTSLSLFLAAVCFANFLPKEIYGNYKYVLSSAAIIGSFSLTGLNSAIKQSVASGFTSSLNHGFRLSIKHSLLFFIISTGVSIYYFFHHNNLLGYGFLLVSIFQPIIQASEVYNAYLNGIKDFKKIAKNNILRTTTVSIFIILITVFSGNVFYLLSIYFVGNMIISFILYKEQLNRNETNDNSQIDTGIISYSKHLSLSNAISRLAFYLDNILVFQFIGSAQVAIYTIALAIPEQFKGLIKIQGSLAAPKLIKIENYSFLIIKIIKMMLILILPVGAYIFLAPTIFMLFFPKYLESIFITQIIAISVLFTTAIQQAAFEAKKEIKINYIFNITSSIFRIVVLTSSIILGGLIGLAIGHTISRVFNFILSILLLIKMQKNSTSTQEAKD